MSFWKKLFGKKETSVIEISKEPIDSVPQDQAQATPALPQPEREFLDIKCDICNNIIGKDKRRKAGGKVYHKSCFQQQYHKLRSQGKAF